MRLWVCICFFIFVAQVNAQISDFETIDFQEADAIALKYKNERLDNLPELSYKLTSNLNTDVERFRAIYRWVCGNISNDYKLFFKNKRKRERYRDDSLQLDSWNTDFKKEILDILIKDKRTICTGYAYIIKELASLSDIDCEIIQGYAKTSTTNVEKLLAPNHSWNAVKLNGKWYLCDPTWASGIPDPETNVFTFNYNDGFFLANPELFAINHYPVDKKWSLLNDKSPSFKDFLDAPILYGKAYSNLTHHDAPKQMHSIIQTNDIVPFKYQLQNSVNSGDVNFLIDNGYESKKTKPTSISIENESLALEYQFKKTGFYDVHLYIKDDLISTYTFRVKKEI